MTHIGLTPQHRQSQTLTPRLQQAVRLLQLSALDYEQALNAMVEQNPFLELEEMDDESAPWSSSRPVADRQASAADQVADHKTPEGSADGDLPGAQAVDMEPNDSWHHLPGATADGGRADGYLGAPGAAAQVCLRQQLRVQANLLPLSERDRTLVHALIESVDDDGYLRTELAEVAALAAFDPPAEDGEMTTALKLVQSFEPAGVGARSVAECLLRQLDDGTTACTLLCRRIVGEHLDKLARRDIAGLARALDRPASDILEACAAVRRLNPYPGSTVSPEEIVYPRPDVVVCKLRGRWTAQLHPAAVPRLRLNQGYADLFRKHRQAAHSEMQSHLQDARWTIGNVEQRCSTILAVAQAIVRHQYGFFEHGPLAMKPLALRDIAQELGIHESTVSRVTNNKYMAAPSGLLELKRFFSRPMALASGGSCSPTAIRELVQEIVAAEDPLDPLSDVEIARRLVRQGVAVARRTVTKYRQLLHVAPVEDRRRKHGSARTRDVQAGL